MTWILDLLRASTRRGAAFAFAAMLAAAGCAAARHQSPADPLPSWNDGAAKRAIVEFVRATTTEGSPDFVPPAERVATFDNDGTLWSEKPAYVQLSFMMDEAKSMAARHPEWKSDPVFHAIEEHDEGALAHLGDKALMDFLVKANSGMTVDEYDRTITAWLATARHPRYGRPYTTLVYQPMLELLAWMRASGFRTWIVSGGSIEFMRPWVEKAYGIPREQVVGTIPETAWENGSRGATLVRGPRFAFVDDGAGKPIGIWRSIGRRPVAAFGNSDGDLPMLQYTAAGSGRRLMLLVHHDDAARESAYDRRSPVGRLDKALDEATARHWVVVSMKDDWKTVFPGAK